MTKSHLEPTQEAGRAFFQRGIAGPVVMLNLLRFRTLADYAANPELAPRRSSAMSPMPFRTSCAAADRCCSWARAVPT